MVSAADHTQIQGMLPRLEALRAGLAPKARAIADYILGHPANIIHMSVTELAEATGASEGTIISLCQQLGAKGYQQFKISLARDLVQPVQFIHEDLAREDSTATVVDKIFSSNMQAMRDTQRILDIAALDKAAEALIRSRRVELYGIGTSAPIAEDCTYRLMRIGIEAKFVADNHVQAISASLVTPDIATITFSHSGSTHETLNTTRLAKEKGATTICVTNYARSPILKYADIVLHTMARETDFRSEAMTSRIAQLAIVDALIATIALKTYDKALATISHTFDIISTKRL